MEVEMLKMSYVQKKIKHMRRIGLVSGKSTGIGMHGGACPDWLKDQQKKDK